MLDYLPFVGQTITQYEDRPSLSARYLGEIISSSVVSCALCIAIRCRKR